MINNPTGAVIKNPERRCTACGNPQIAAVAPGSETVRSDLLNLALDAGRPLVGWCMACWVQRFAHEYRA